MPNERPVPARPPSLRGALAFSAILIAVDAFYMNQGVIALLTGLWLLFVSLPRTFLAKKFATVRTPRLRNIAVCVLAVVLVFAFNWANNRLARSRADVLVAAVKAFRAKNQRYPKTLEELVPDYVERIPVAKYTLAFNEFHYATSGDYTALSYVALPPFGRPTYSFTRDRWGYLD